MDQETELTIAVVARKAGVSISTVSRILNGKNDVAQATRTRVQQVIDELGYIPHAQAQRLRAGKTRNLALIFPLKYPSNVPYNPLDMEIIVGAATAAGERNFFFSLLSNSVTKHNLLQFYRSAQVDGLILLEVRMHDWRANLLRQHDYPFVMIGRCEDNTGLSYIDLDFEAAIRLALQQLIGMGHRAIGFVAHAAELREQGYGPAVRTWNSYHAFVQQTAIRSAYREVSEIGQDVFKATLELLDELPELTAIITAHSYASSIIQALNQRGRRVPEDCSVVGITGNRIAELSAPALANIEFPAHEMGYKAVEMLTRRLEGTAAVAEQVCIPPKLIMHSSIQPTNTET